jgi:hypothetical protein
MSLKILCYYLVSEEAWLPCYFRVRKGFQIHGGRHAICLNFRIQIQLLPPSHEEWHCSIQTPVP